MFLNNRKIQNQMIINNQLPYSDAEKEYLRKNAENISKNNKMMAIMLVLLGIVLLFSGFSIIF